MPQDLQRNRAVTDTYEPGSTFKVVTVGAALSERLVSPDTAFTLPYEIQVADRMIHDAHERGTERMTVAQILSQSSNVGTITLAEKLGSAQARPWISRFGFGHKTGIDFPGETPGIVLPLEKWSGSTIGNVPIGQGIAVTPVQMAAAYGDGRERRRLGPAAPRRARRRAPRAAAAAHGRILTPGVARQVMAMMQDVVNEGTGRRRTARLQGRRQDGNGVEARPERRLLDERYVASFVGIVPATNPRLVVLVTVDEPPARSGAASSRLRRSSRSPATISSTWRSRRTTPRLYRLSVAGRVAGSLPPQWS